MPESHDYRADSTASQPSLRHEALVTTREPQVAKHDLRIASDESGTRTHAATIIAPGRNCWRTARANRIAWLIDAAAYFSAFREAVKRARRSIFILAWDIDSRAVLVPDGSPDGWPATVGELLNRVVSERRGLHAYVLDWDYPVLYQTDREIATAYSLGWRTHRRLKFRMDGEHPVGGSHHQKLVVIDDAVAFVGGLDLTKLALGHARARS